jgi:Transglutaminase-like superfamily
LLLRIPPLRNFLSLPVPERRILIRAFFLLAVIRLGMWLVPFRTLQQTLGKLFPSPATATGQPLSPEKVLSAKKTAWAVRAVSRYVPAATCLAQALTLRALLSREGIPSDLAIGVARGDESGIAAHAWLEIDGTAIIGGEERDRFTRLKTQE